MSGLAVSARLRIVELVRQPLTLLMLLLLPPVVIETYGTAVASFPQLPTVGTDPATVGRMTGTLFAVAFLAGLVGLFQVLSARKGDERAAVAGLSRHTLLGSRILTMVLVAVVGAAVAFGVFSLRVDVAAPGIGFAALVAAGLVYGLLGVLIGTLVPRELEGSILLVFVADLDNALSSGLFPLTTTVSLPVLGDVHATDVVPLYHPHELFAAAVLDGELAVDHLLPILGWVSGLLVLAFAAYGRSTGGWSLARLRRRFA
ncbi:MAG: ABC transporter permease [Halobacteriales archaeon]